MSRSILDTRRFQHTSHLGRQLLPIFSKDSLHFCIMSDPMRRPILERDSCRGTSAGSSSSSTAALEAFQKSSWMRSPLRSAKISEVVRLGGHPNSWAVRNSKAMSRALRHAPGIKLGNYLEASMEQLEKFTFLKPFSWEPRKFFSLKQQRPFPDVDSTGGMLLQTVSGLGLRCRDIGHSGAQPRARASLGSRSG